MRERYSAYPYLAAGGYDDLDEVGLGEILPGVEYTSSKFMNFLPIPLIESIASGLTGIFLAISMRGALAQTM